LHPTLAQVTGTLAFSGDNPQPLMVLLPPKAHGQLDIFVVFYAPQFPTTGTLAFSLDQLRPTYEWGSITNPGENGYHFQGPWNLTIPLS
jgi:hypothetical protein